MTTLRSKGTKTDEELAIEYKQIQNIPIHHSHEAHANRKEAILKELGQNHLDFLLFKIETEKRLNEIEATQQGIMSHLGMEVHGGVISFPPHKTWCQRLFS